MSLASQLNDKQLEAMKYTQGPLLVLAGAGSGKTSVITRKIAYLVKHCGIPAHRITAMTFTNKAAREMKERVTKLLTREEAKGLSVSTFHTFGLNLLRLELKHTPLKNNFSILDADDCKRILMDLMHRDNLVRCRKQRIDCQSHEDDFGLEKRSDSTRTGSHDL
jgi:Superfamily I DNA and RNA helicases